MPTAVCPGHITCFFQPAGPTDGNYLARGSRGAGIRIALGATVDLQPRTGTAVKVVIDGVGSPAPVTQAVLEMLLPGQGCEVVVTNDVPCGQGFGMSAAGAIAVALCAAEMTGKDADLAYMAAHTAEIVGGGGLGDVAALTCLADQPVRVKPGLPPLGRVIGTGLSFSRLTLAVLGPKLNTGAVLADAERCRALTDAGQVAVDEFLAAPMRERLFAISNRFAADTGVEGQAVGTAVRALRAQGIQAAMCMLGNSLCADAAEEEVREIIGDAGYFECASTSEQAHLLIHTA